LDRIYQLVSDVFGVPVGAITTDSSSDTIETWDSLSHINLILAIESEFGISLSPEEAMDMLTVGLIQTILSERGALAS
jgi:acyl carrier protein